MSCITLGKVGEKTGRTAAPGRGFSLISNAKLRELYSSMLKCRALEERVRLLAKQRAPGNDHGSRHEACAVGAAIDLRPTDAIAPANYDFMASLVKGAPLDVILASLPANSAGRARRSPALGDQSYVPLNILPAATDSATRLGIATGVAFAFKYQNKGNMVLAFSGHESASLGESQAAMALAGAHQLPILFMLQPELPARTGNAKRNLKAPTLIVRTEAFGFPTIAVDGEDVVAVYRVAHESIARARQGGAPTMIECRMAPTGEASNGETCALRDPLVMMEQYLSRKGLFTSNWKQRVLHDFDTRLQIAVDSAAKTSAHAGQDSPRPGRRSAKARD